ncbi:hypothetical protein AX17_000143 [Amanita inopinata Kibby_2008]|nr:hypothetical protein AX17_000143 [Amanita inopinata Kibby_2008]
MSDDIYRGDPPPESSVHHVSSSSSSSSASFVASAPLGNLAAVVEHAIARWAKRRGSSSRSSTTSSSSSCSSVTTNARSSKPARRRPSLSTFHSERDFTARITRIKAREEFRQIPRQFVLYLPPSLLHGSRSRASTQGLTSTSSLPLALNRLDAALRLSLKAQRTHERGRALNVTHPASSHPQKKGKQRYDTSKRSDEAGQSESTPMPKAWYFDIASPTWEDLRAIGKLLHLHPLTLEDILQKDPREKLEHFPKLGYYFLSFRAIESRSTRERLWQKERLNGESSYAEVPLGEANVYLTVFKDGICSFHFTDISEHTDRVRNRISHLEEVFNMSSDWIAHGILDSIVDSFFPYLEEIEKEVVAIDKLLFAGHDGQLPSGVPDVVTVVGTRGVEQSEKAVDTGETRSEAGLTTDHALAEKLELEDAAPAPTQFSLPRLPKLVFSRHIGCFMFRWNRLSKPSLTQDSTITLRRIAKTRRLVTSLSRLLAAKSEVVAQIRKRLMTAARTGLGSGVSKDDMNIAMYMGDVQDHILTLQLSLAHYERILSHLHPTYLSQLRTNFALTKAGKGKSLLYLSVITIAVLCIQTYVGILSMNVTVPHNDRIPSGSYHIFGVVVAIAIVILCVYYAVIWWWWKQAKRRHGTML